MFGDNKDYIFFIFVLLAAIVISLGFHVFFPANKDEGFSEIYFPFPDDLPNYIDLGKAYNFSFTVKNLEGAPQTYSYDTKIEFFNLYDVTEGLYKCAAKQRKKVQMEWIEGNDSNINLYFLQPMNGNSSFMFTKSDDYGKMDWPTYNLEYLFKNVLGQGSFTTAFYNENGVKYSITVYENTSEAELDYKEGRIIKSERRKITLNTGNKVKINATTNELKYYLNDELVFQEELSNLSNVTVAFRTDNTYAFLDQLVSYKDSPIDVTQSKYIRDYNINDRILFYKLDKLREQSEEDVYLIRNAVNSSSKCDLEQCAELKSFLNNPGQASFKLNDRIKYPASLLGLINFTNSLFPDNSILQNSTAPGLDWPNYVFGMSFQIFAKPHTFLINFDKEFMVLFHNADIYFILNKYNSTVIERRTSTVETGVNEITISSNDNKVTFKLNNLPLFNFEEELPFKNISLYTRNTFIIFNRISLSNKNKVCNDFSSKNCRRFYIIPSERNIQSDQTRASAQPVQISNDLGAVQLLGAADIFSIASKQKPNESEALVPIMQKMIDNQIDIDPSMINEEIPSESYTFNGRSARLANKNNYNFGFRFVTLEGAGLIGLSFRDNKDTELMKFVINQPKDKGHLFKNFGGSILKEDMYMNLSKGGVHEFEVTFEFNKTSYALDGKKIFESEGLDMSNGYYSIYTYNTYSDISNIRFFDKNLQEVVPFSISTDPCKLRKIDEMKLEKGSLYLSANENSSITKNFTLSKDFDFGMASVKLSKENQNSSEIHFWVVKND